MINSKRDTARHIIIKLLKAQDREVDGQGDKQYSV